MKRSACRLAILSLLAASCKGGGGGTPAPPPPPQPPTTPPTTPPPTGHYAVPAPESLSTTEVEKVLAQGVAEAKAQGHAATLAVVDRVGNVLAVFAMTGANPRLVVPSAPDGNARDLQGVDAPAAAAGAIAKAITGAYLSSGANAFSTRTASMIVQQHFPPSAVAQGLESGPLFGVQFSQLPCSDVTARYSGASGSGALIGPKRSPLGLAADPGGLPLYRDGVLVGGVGVMIDGVYSFDPEVQDVDKDSDEIVALAASAGFEASPDIQADRISIDGSLLRYSDAAAADLKSNPASAPAFASLIGSAGTLASVRGYYDAAGGVLPGRVYGSEASGVRPASVAEFSNRDAFVLTDGAGGNRFPVRAGTDNRLTATQVRDLLEEAFEVMSAARAQIRRPLDSRAQVSITVVDTTGAVLGLVRAPDAPIFGIDVSVQKARTAVFFSSDQTASALDNSADPELRRFITSARAFFHDSAAFTGAYAFSARAIGNISRPHFPDGEVARPPGPFSRPIAEFNPFSTGLQSALVAPDMKAHLAFVINGSTDVPAQCASGTAQGRLANGMQIFPGAVPLYAGSQLVGAIGVSGDGVDQDDMISFLDAHNGGARIGAVTNAAPSIRADQIVVQLAGGGTARLRYVNCPVAPFLGSSDQNVCQGK